MRAPCPPRSALSLSLDVLPRILLRAFALTGKNFGVSYLGLDWLGREAYLALLSDWDLSTAFATASKPYLRLRVDTRPAEDSLLLEAWDIVSPRDVTGSDALLPEKRSPLTAAAVPFAQSVLAQVGRTLSKIQQVLGGSHGKDAKPSKPPLGDAEFHTSLNREGQLGRPAELRLRVYHERWCGSTC